MRQTIGARIGFTRLGKVTPRGYPVHTAHRRPSDDNVSGVGSSISSPHPPHKLCLNPIRSQRERLTAGQTTLGQMRAKSWTMLAKSPVDLQTHNFFIFCLHFIDSPRPYSATRRSSALIIKPSLPSPDPAYNPAAIEDTGEPLISQDALDRIFRLVLDRILAEKAQPSA